MKTWPITIVAIRTAVTSERLSRCTRYSTPSQNRYAVTQSLTTEHAARWRSRSSGFSDTRSSMCVNHSCGQATKGQPKSVQPWRRREWWRGKWDNHLPRAGVREPRTALPRTILSILQSRQTRPASPVRSSALLMVIHRAVTAAVNCKVEGKMLLIVRQSNETGGCYVRT